MHRNYTPATTAVRYIYPRCKNTGFLRLLFILLAIGCCDTALAYQGGDGVPVPVLSGSVSDAVSRRPVRGVTISVTSSHDRIEKSFKTDASGNFVIPRLPAGEVTIVLEKKGYKTYRREKIIVKEGMQVKLNFDISNEHAKEEGNFFHPLLRMMEG